EEVDRADEGEEAERLGEKRSHDAHRRENGDDGAGDEEIADDALDLVPRTQMRADALAGQVKGQGAARGSCSNYERGGQSPEFQHRLSSRDFVVGGLAGYTEAGS